MSKPSFSPLIYDYLRKYQEDPTSRIFAPLAEAYRKAGLIDEAIEIAREGLQIHPGFVGGRVALARALFDKKKYQEVVDQLAPVVRDVPDNLVAQRLLAESYLIQGQVAESLGAYKMLLYYSPNDTETARIVDELETQAYDQGTLVLRTDPPKTTDPVYDIRSAGSAISAHSAVKREDWIRKVEKLQGMLQKVERYRERVGRSKRA